MKTLLRSMLLFIVVGCTSIGIFAQENKLTFGVKAGMNVSSVNGKGTDDADAKIGFNVGVTADYAITENIYLLTGLEFTTKGAKYSDILMEELEEVVKGDLTFNPMYLQLPIHIGYKYALNDAVTLVAQAGPYFAVGVGGKATAKATILGKEIKDKANIFGSGDEDLDYKRFDFGLGLAFGVEYQKFNVKAGYDFGLVNYAPNTSGNFKTRNGNFYVTLGYHF